jgi:hypothetical protein
MPDDNGDLTADELDDAYELAAGNVHAWLQHPCNLHLWYVGVGCGSVPGYSPHLVLETTGRIIADWLADNPDEPAPDLTPLLVLLGEISDAKQAG